MLFNPKEKGQGLLEYALIIVLILVIILTTITLYEDQVRNFISSIISTLTK